MHRFQTIWSSRGGKANGYNLLWRPLQASPGRPLQEPNDQDGKQTRTQSRAEGSLIKERYPILCQNEQVTTAAECLEYSKTLHSVEKGLLHLFNKLNDPN